MPDPAPKRYLAKSLLFLSILVLGMGLGILSLAMVLAGEIYDYQDTVDAKHLPPVDAIVCLAGGRGRITAAGDLWLRYWELSPTQVPVLYISGMGQKATWLVFAKQLRAGVREVIKPDNVVLETESLNTAENAEVLAHVAHERGWSKFVLLTSSYHMKRARLIFGRVLEKTLNEPEISLETLSLVQEHFEPGQWRTDLQGIRVTLDEYFKWIYYRYFW